MDNRILALDLSLASTGWAVISIEDRRPYLLDHGAIKTNAKETHGKRLSQISKGVDSVTWDYGGFIAIAKEKGFSRHAATTQAIYKVHGVIEELFAHDYVIIDIPPTTVKKLVTGSGKASKEDVEMAVRRLLGLRDDYEIETDDESDAMAVALAYAIENDLVDV